MEKSLWLQKFIDIYSQLATDNLDTLEQVYHPDVTFIDPLHRVEGYQALLNSFSHSYSNIVQCDFVIDDYFQSDDKQAAIYWTMTFRHKTLNKTKPVIVTGHSHIKAKDNKVIYHRDYLDLGAMIYECVPILGMAIKAIKQRAVQ